MRITDVSQIKTFDDLSIPADLENGTEINIKGIRLRLQETDGHNFWYTRWGWVTIDQYDVLCECFNESLNREYIEEMIKTNSDGIVICGLC